MVLDSREFLCESQGNPREKSLMFLAEEGLRGALLSSARMFLGLDSGLLARAPPDLVENIQALMSHGLTFSSWVSHLLVGDISYNVSEPPSTW